MNIALALIGLAVAWLVARSVRELLRTATTLHDVVKAQGTALDRLREQPPQRCPLAHVVEERTLRLRRRVEP